MLQHARSHGTTAPAPPPRPRPRADRRGCPPPAAAADTVTLSVDVSRSPARRSTARSSASSRSTSGPASTRASGWAPTPRSRTPAASATTSWPPSRRSGAERALAGRVLRGRVPLAQGHRPAARRDPQPQLGRRHGVERVRHARVPGLPRADRRRGLPLRQRRLGHAAGGRRVAGVPDRRAADDAGEGASRQRPSRALEDRLPGHRQRELGLRRQHDAAVLPEPAGALQPLRPELQPGAGEGPAPDAEDRRGPRRRRAPLDGVDRRDHEGVAGPLVELGHGRPVPAQLHRAEVAPVAQVHRVRRERVRRDPEDDARDGPHRRDPLGDHGQVRPAEEDRAGRRRVGRLVRTAARDEPRLPGPAEQPARRRSWPRST